MSLYGLMSIPEDDEGRVWKYQKKGNKLVSDIETDLFKSALVGE